MQLLVYLWSIVTAVSAAPQLFFVVPQHFASPQQRSDISADSRVPVVIPIATGKAISERSSVQDASVLVDESLAGIMELVQGLSMNEITEALKRSLDEQGTINGVRIEAAPIVNTDPQIAAENELEVESASGGETLVQENIEVIHSGGQNSEAVTVLPLPVAENEQATEVPVPEQTTLSVFDSIIQEISSPKVITKPVETSATNDETIINELTNLQNPKSSSISEATQEKITQDESVTEFSTVSDISASELDSMHFITEAEEERKTVETDVENRIASADPVENKINIADNIKEEIPLSEITLNEPFVSMPNIEEIANSHQPLENIETHSQQPVENIESKAEPNIPELLQDESIKSDSTGKDSLLAEPIQEKSSLPTAVHEVIIASEPAQTIDPVSVVSELIPNDIAFISATEEKITPIEIQVEIANSTVIPTNTTLVSSKSAESEITIADHTVKEATTLEPVLDDVTEPVDAQVEVALKSPSETMDSAMNLETGQVIPTSPEILNASENEIKDSPIHQGETAALEARIDNEFSNLVPIEEEIPTFESIQNIDQSSVSLQLENEKTNLKNNVLKENVAGVIKKENQVELKEEKTGKSLIQDTGRSFQETPITVNTISKSVQKEINMEENVENNSQTALPFQENQEVLSLPQPFQGGFNFDEEMAVFIDPVEIATINSEPEPFGIVVLDKEEAFLSGQVSTKDVTQTPIQEDLTETLQEENIPKDPVEEITTTVLLQESPVVADKIKEEVFNFQPSIVFVHDQNAVIESNKEKSEIIVPILSPAQQSNKTSEPAKEETVVSEPSIESATNSKNSPEIHVVLEVVQEEAKSNPDHDISSAGILLEKIDASLSAPKIISKDENTNQNTLIVASDTESTASDSFQKELNSDIVQNAADAHQSSLPDISISTQVKEQNNIIQKQDQDSVPESIQSNLDILNSPDNQVADPNSNSEKHSGVEHVEAPVTMPIEVIVSDTMLTDPDITVSDTIVPNPEVADPEKISQEKVISEPAQKEIQPTDKLQDDVTGQSLQEGALASVPDNDVLVADQESPVVIKDIKEKESNAELVQDVVDPINNQKQTPSKVEINISSTTQESDTAPESTHSKSVNTVPTNEITITRESKKSDSEISGSVVSLLGQENISISGLHEETILAPKPTKEESSVLDAIFEKNTPPEITKASSSDVDTTSQEGASLTPAAETLPTAHQIQENSDPIEPTQEAKVTTEVSHQIIVDQTHNEGSNISFEPSQEGITDSKPIEESSVASDLSHQSGTLLESIQNMETAEAHSQDTTQEISSAVKPSKEAIKNEQLSNKVIDQSTGKEPISLTGTPTNVETINSDSMQIQINSQNEFVPTESPNKETSDIEPLPETSALVEPHQKDNIEMEIIKEKTNIPKTPDVEPSLENPDKKASVKIQHEKQQIDISVQTLGEDTVPPVKEVSIIVEESIIDPQQESSHGAQTQGETDVIEPEVKQAASLNPTQDEPEVSSLVNQESISHSGQKAIVASESDHELINTKKELSAVDQMQVGNNEGTFIEETVDAQPLMETPDSSSIIVEESPALQSVPITSEILSDANTGSHNLQNSFQETQSLEQNGQISKTQLNEPEVQLKTETVASISEIISGTVKNDIPQNDIQTVIKPVPEVANEIPPNVEEVTLNKPKEILNPNSGGTLQPEQHQEDVQGSNTETQVSQATQVSGKSISQQESSNTILLAGANAKTKTEQIQRVSSPGIGKSITSSASSNSHVININPVARHFGFRNPSAVTFTNSRNYMHHGALVDPRSLVAPQFRSFIYSNDSPEVVAAKVAFFRIQERLISSRP